MSSSNSVSGSNEISGFSSATNGATGRVSEDITRKIHSSASSTTTSLVEITLVLV